MSTEKPIITNPSLLSSVLSLSVDGTPTSWIQLARTGSFVSSRYGQFSITRDDLKQMLHNFEHVTPKAPTQLPIDYDHLSMTPQKPGDGIAAGWLTQLRLRADGDELWGLVSWTAPAAAKIKEGEYKFISPSFVKDHTHKDGSKIGTTLLAAAITNHPFLEGMDALTLYSFGVMGHIATRASEDAGETHNMATTTKVLSMAEIGQRVMIAPGKAHTQDEVGGTFEITKVVGVGDDAFVAVRDGAGNTHEWFRVTDLLPASATTGQVPSPNLPVPNRFVGDDASVTIEKSPKPKMPTEDGKPEEAPTDLADAMNRIAKARNLSATEAAKVAQREYPELAQRWAGGEMTAQPAAALHLKAETPREKKSEPALYDLARKIAIEERLDLRASLRAAASRRPDLVEAYRQQFYSIGVE
jgi:hypothetical protein